MLFLRFQIGSERYALETGRIVEVIPLVALQPLSHAPKGVAGLFLYHGRAVPALDLSELTQGRPAVERLSTRIIIVDYSDGHGREVLVGLIAEFATETVRVDAKEIAERRAELPGGTFPGPVLLDEKGPIHYLNAQRLFPEPLRDLLFRQGNQNLSLSNA
jgi:chemotaxis-related protein WspB